MTPLVKQGVPTMRGTRLFFICRQTLSGALPQPVAVWVGTLGGYRSLGCLPSTLEDPFPLQQPHSDRFTPTNTRARTVAARALPLLVGAGLIQRPISFKSKLSQSGGMPTGAPSSNGMSAAARTLYLVPSGPVALPFTELKRRSGGPNSKR